MKFRIALVLPLVLSACAHRGGGYEDVRPGEQGLNTVRLKVADEVEGSREAIRQARNYCEELDKQAAVVGEESKYVGEISEENYRRLKRASKAAGTLGGSTIGQKGDQALSDYAGDPYQVEMKFRCVDRG